MQPRIGYIRSEVEETQQLQELDRIDDLLNARTSSIFSKVLPFGSRKLKQDKVALASEIMQHSESPEVVRKVSSKIQTEVLKMQLKASSGKYTEYEGRIQECREIQKKGDKRLVQSSRLKSIRMSSIKSLQGEEIEYKDLMGSAFTQPGYAISFPVEESYVTLRGLGVGTDGQVEASGAFSRVLFGENRGQEIAVKFIKVNRENRQAIEQESSFLLKMEGSQHVLGALHVIYVTHPVRECPLLACMVMRRMTGGTLLDKVNKRQGEEFPLTERIVLLKEAAMGIRELHEQGFIHKDIKGENILIQEGPGGDQRAYLSDLGGTGYQTEKSLFFGTPGFIAPEVLSGKREGYPESDVFSFGAVIYETITGEPLFDCMHYQEDLATNKKTLARQYLGLNGADAISDQLAEIVNGCIELVPSVRMTIDEVIILLERMKHE